MDNVHKKKDQKNSKVEIFVDYEKVGLDGLKTNMMIKKGDLEWKIQTNTIKKNYR